MMASNSTNIESANKGEAVSQLAHMSRIDYIVFGVMFVVSVICLCFGEKMKTTAQSCVGNRKLEFFPVAMSVSASLVSVISLFGVPSTIVTQGVSYLFVVALGKLVALPIVAYLFLPVFFNFKLTSANDYLELRFNKIIRLVGVVLFLMESIFIYAVLAYIVIEGIYEEGGASTVIDRNLRNGRPPFFNFDFDPKTKYTFWNALFGHSVYWIYKSGVNQVIVQRYIGLGDLREAIKALWIALFLFIAMNVFLTFTGMLLYSRHEYCDPIASKIVERSDQVLPLYVMHDFRHMKELRVTCSMAVGVVGLWTVLSGTSSMVLTTVEDIVKKHWTGLSDKKLVTLARILSFCFALQTFALSFVVEQMGSVLSALFAVIGLFSGPLLSLFVLGMFVPSANPMGAFCGATISFIVMTWIALGYQVGLRTNFIMRKKLIGNICPNYAVGVLANYSETMRQLYEEYDSRPFNFLRELYSVSSMYYPAMGLLLALLIGVPASAFLGKKTDLKRLNPKLLSPFVTWCKKIYPSYNIIGVHVVPEDENLAEYPDNEEIKTSKTKETRENPISRV